jgi:hypothetical protein
VAPESSVSVSIQMSTFVRLVHALRDRGDMRDPVVLIGEAIERWIETPAIPPKPTQVRQQVANRRSERPWRDDIIDALRDLRGRAPRLSVVEAVYRMRKARGDSVPRTYEAIIQRTLQHYCPQSKVFDGNPDHALFLWPDGAGAGIWALNEPVTARFLQWRDRPVEQWLAEYAAPLGKA